jgi:hypothetical protein
MAHAEQLAAARGCPATVVIAGVGTRGYYSRLGYELLPDAEGGYMRKRLPRLLRLRAGAQPYAAAALSSLPLLAALLAMVMHWFIK